MYLQDGSEHDAVEDAGAEDGAVSEQLEGEVRDLGEELLPERKCD